MTSVIKGLSVVVAMVPLPLARPNSDCCSLTLGLSLQQPFVFAEEDSCRSMLNYRENTCMWISQRPREDGTHMDHLHAMIITEGNVRGYQVKRLRKPRKVRE